MLGSYTHQSVE